MGISATVIIPVKNGGKVLGECLEAVRGQRTTFPFEVLCIDSGSRDDSVATIEKSGARLYQIPSHEFGHGKTRNLGVSLSQTPFVALITQDAIPAHDGWLEALITPFRFDANLAGVFGPHLPHDDARPTERYMLERHFAQWGDEPITHRIGHNPRTWDEYVERQDFFCFFSDNNAALRRSVWEQIPYRDVDFMEDRLWATAALEAGYGKAYAPKAAVHHSHNYDGMTTLRRAFDEARFRRMYEDPSQSWGLSKWLAHARVLARRDDARLVFDLGRGRALPESAGALIRHSADAVGRFLGDNSPFLPRTLISRLSQHNSLRGGESARGASIPEDVRHYVKATLASRGTIDGAAELAHQVVHLARESRQRRLGESLLSWRRSRTKAVDNAGWWSAGQYRFMREEAGALLSDRSLIQSDSRILNWVIPPFGEGGGGHINIFRMIHMLEKHGFANRVYVLDGEAAMPYSNAQLRSFVHKWFSPVDASIEPLRDTMLPADMAIATHWSTAWAVRAIGNARMLGYFVQDFEPLFYSASAEGLFAEATYRMGFKGIAAGRWLGEMMRTRYEMDAVDYPLAVDHETYWPETHTETASRVFAYVRPGTPRRAFELVSLALAEVHRQRPKAEIHTAGAKLHSSQIPFPATVHGVMNATQLRSMYSRMTVGVAASLSNYSMLPQEMAACGLPVIDIDGENTRAVYPKDAVVLAPPTVEGLSREILKLLDDPLMRRVQSNRGLEYARSLSWGEAGDVVAESLRRWFSQGNKSTRSSRLNTRKNES